MMTPPDGFWKVFARERGLTRREETRTKGKEPGRRRVRMDILGVSFTDRPTLKEGANHRGDDHDRVTGIS